MIMVKSKTNLLRIGLLNVRSLNTGKEELCASVQVYDLDILALNETWIKKGGDKYAPTLPGYVFKHKPRESNQRGGGVGFYIKKNFRAKVRPHPFSKLEQIWIEITLPGGKMALCSAYRPDTITVTEALNELSVSISNFSYCKYLCILTDFNVNFLHPNVHSFDAVNDFLIQLNLKQIVNSATRISGEKTSLLDLIITNVPQFCTNVDIIHNPDLSDHALVFADFKIEKPRIAERFYYSRCLYKVDMNSFHEDLNVLPWDTIYKESDVNKMVNIFNELIILLFNKHAPLKPFRCKNKHYPWITDVIKIMMEKRNAARKRALASKKETHFEYYKSLRNYTNASIHRERTAYFNTYINSNSDNSKKMWNHLKATTLLDDPCIINIPPNLKKPDSVNDFFLKLPDDDTVDENLLKWFRDNKFSSNVFTMDMCTSNDVLKIINNIKSNAFGYDTITVNMLKMTLPRTLDLVTFIINKSIHTNVFPNQWKIARVIPIPKTKSVTQYKDLRPISLLPILSKIIEKVVYKQLILYLEGNKILPQLQSGFRAGHATSTALLHVTDDILTATDVRKCTFLILLDFTHAFDFLNKDLLLAKMSYYGFSVDACNWFNSYLSNRQQFVEMDNDRGERVRSCYYV